jgi:hypothetical protein
MLSKDLAMAVPVPRPRKTLGNRGSKIERSSTPPTRIPSITV